MTRSLPPTRGGGAGPDESGCSPIVGAGGVALDRDHGDRILGVEVLRIADPDRRDSPSVSRL